MKTADLIARLESIGRAQMPTSDPTAILEAATRLATLEAEAAALRAERDAAVDRAIAAEQEERAWYATAEKLRERKNELAAALKPFAEVAENFGSAWLDHETHWCEVFGRINVGQLRAARATLAKEGQGHD